MATLQTQSFTTIVGNFAAAVQGAASTLVNFSTGSILRALAQAFGGVALWLQGLIVTLMNTIRLSTSTDTDVDSWLADFGFYRLPAVAATGYVTFSRLTPTNQAIIPVGSIVQTGDGTQQFIINADTTNAAYSATVISGGGFIIPAGTTSINCIATSITAGSSGYPDATGNVSAGTITALFQAIPYVDTVTNANPFTTGQNPESDSAVKARFPVWLNSLAEGTAAAVGAAVQGVQSGLTYTILENQQYNGTTQQGYFSVVVNDGTGNPSTTLLNNIASAINLIRPLTSTFGVFGPVKVPIVMYMVITSASGYVHTQVTATVQAALYAYIQSLGMGASVSYTKLAQIAYESSAGVAEVSAGYSINSTYNDIAVTGIQCAYCAGLSSITVV